MKTAYLVPIIILLILTSCATQPVAEKNATATSENLANETIPVEKVEKTVEETNQTVPVQSENKTEEMNETKETTPEEKTEAADENEAETAAEKLEAIKSTEDEKTKIEELLEKFAQGVKSYSFIYHKNKYLVRNPQVKIELNDYVYAKSIDDIEGKTHQFVYLDTIYLNMDVKSAVAYCEGNSEELKQMCINYKVENVPFQRLYGDYTITLPEQWLFEFLNRKPHLVEENKYVISKRSTTLVEFTDADKTTDLYFDERIGLPVMVKVTQGDIVLKEYNYDNLVINHVRAVDVVHRSASQIPSSEAFDSTLP